MLLQTDGIRRSPNHEFGPLTLAGLPVQFRSGSAASQSLQAIDRPRTDGGEIGDGKIFVTTLEECIRAGTGAVAADLLQAVAEAAPEIAVKMVPELLFSEDHDLQREVVRILGIVNPGHFSASVLVGMLKTPGEQVRLRIIDMIMETSDPWAFDPLMARIQSPSSINIINTKFIFT